MTSFRLMEWNANGLMRHQHELEAILWTEKIDICLISETHFTNDSFINFKNYTMYRTIHPTNTARGGTAVIVKNNIKHFEEDQYASLDIQATTVTIESSRKKNSK